LRGAFRKVPAISVLAALIAIGASDCVRVPPADPIASGPSIDQVVRRVKCDLVGAIRPYLDNEKYTWLQTWTAQASLTFIVNDASTLTPGATFIQPLTTETLPLRVMNSARSWNFGAGAGFNTTASRNETVTFSMSLKEIKDSHQSDPESDFCDYPDLTDLHSDLGLKQWMESALSPTQNNELIPGHHKTTKSGSPGAAGSSSAQGGGGGGAAQGTSALAGGFQSLDAGMEALTKSFSGPQKDNRLPVIIKNGKCELPPRAYSDPLDRLYCEFLNLLTQIAKSEVDDPATIVTTSVSGITPMQGSTLGGTLITIIGNNFDNLSDHGDAVTIGGVAVNHVDITVANDSTICAYAPPHAPTPSETGVDVVVNASGGAGTKIAGYKYSDASTDPVLAITPHFGQTNANTLVKITGKDFTGATGVVKIGDQPAKNVSIDTKLTPHTITATAPPHAAGPVDVVVTTKDGNNLTVKDLFNYYQEDHKPVIKCTPQASAKKKVIAYVDLALDQKIDKALFKSRELVNLIEDRMKVASSDSARWKDLNDKLQTTKALADSLLALQLDPPLDAIGHQVQFIIVFNASVSPSWTLLHFKGPTPGSGSGASATATLTHTLNIAMGPPSSPDVASTLGALQLGTAIGNSIGTGAISITPP
jgi:hypothetical protein